MLDQLVTLFGEKARRAGIGFSVARDVDVPSALTGDPARIGQILINLVSNALKFTRRESVRVRVALDKALDERVSLHFSVVDLGRADSVRRSAPEVPPDDWRPSRCSALLAEDNRINQEIAVELLRLCGMETDAAVDGEEAVRAALARRYDAIFMDIRMPVLDGLAACRRIRGSGVPWAADVPIVALTANARPGTSGKASRQAWAPTLPSRWTSKACAGFCSCCSAPVRSAPDAGTDSAGKGGLLFPPSA